MKPTLHPAAPRDARRALAALVVLQGLTACGRQEVQPAPEPSRPVRVESIRPGAFSPTVRLLGVVAAGESVPVTAPATGTARYPPGDRGALRTGAIVTAGERLLLLEDEDARHAVVEARLSVDQVDAEVVRLRRGFEDGVVEESRLEDAEARLRLGRERLVSARAKAATRSLEAPRAGTLAVDAPIPAGMLIPAGTVIARVVTDGALRVEAVAAASDRAALVPGLGARLVAAGHPDGRARVAEVAPIVDPAGTVRVALEVLSWEDPPAPGEGTEVDVELPARMDALTLPVTALAVGSGGATAYVIERAGMDAGPTHRARRRAVTLGRRSHDRVEILSGLSDGDRVVVTGADVLSDGDGVSIEEAPAAGN